MADDKTKKPEDQKKKEENQDTLVRYFDEEINTQKIDLAEHYASRRLGRHGGMKIRDSLEKLRKKKDKDKK